MNEKLAKVMGNQIVRRLSDLNMTQKDFANLVGTTPEQINFICSGKRIPKIDVIPLYAKTLQCDLDYLFATKMTNKEWLLTMSDDELSNWMINESVQVTSKYEDKVKGLASWLNETVNFELYDNGNEE